eukprot:32232-Rhodomonas_salina.1
MMRRWARYPGYRVLCSLSAFKLPGGPINNNNHQTFQPRRDRAVASSPQPNRPRTRGTPGTRGTRAPGVGSTRVPCIPSVTKSATDRPSHTCYDVTTKGILNRVVLKITFNKGGQ